MRLSELLIESIVIRSIIVIIVVLGSFITFNLQGALPPVLETLLIITVSAYFGSIVPTPQKNIERFEAQ